LGDSETQAFERRRWSGDTEAAEPLRHIHAQTISGGPAFSLLPLLGSGGGGEDRAGGQGKARFLAGLHNRTAVALETDPDGTALRLLPGALPGHTGWVRTLACDDSDGRGGDVYSAACNFLRVWRWPAKEEEASVLPEHLHDVRMFTGDLLQVRAYEGAVYTSGADGALR